MATLSILTWRSSKTDGTAIPAVCILLVSPQYAPEGSPPSPSGATLGDIGAAIQQVAESAGFSVVKEYCGHGVGQEYHAEPQILHYGRPGTGLVLKKGMIFTIEPMINAGKAATSVLSDGWTVVTKDRSLSAQWEHMVAVTDTGFDLLTPWPDPSPEYSGL